MENYLQALLAAENLGYVMVKSHNLKVRLCINQISFFLCCFNKNIITKLLSKQIKYSCNVDNCNKLWIISRNAQNDVPLLIV